MPQNTATQYLRALQSRGLLAANRQSRWVFYVPLADVAVQHAEPMLAAMKKAFLQDEPREEMAALLTAYTHPRRILITRRLAAGTAVAETLAHDTGISVPACYRHLDKLQSRGVVVVDTRGSWKLAPPAPGLAAALLHAALE